MAWADDVLFHADIGEALQAHLPIKSLVELRGTCKEAGNAIAFKPAEARAAQEVHGKELCREAAIEGNLQLLQWAHEQGCPWNATICKLAAQGGHLDSLKYLHDHGCPWYGDTCEAAAGVATSTASSTRTTTDASGV